nr:glycosyltransferase family 4 protein [Pseudomonas sp. RW407]
MERLNWHLIQELAKAAQVMTIGPSEAALLVPSNTIFNPVPLRPLWRFLSSAFRQALCISRRWRPHIIMAGSGLTAPIALLAARTCGAKAVAYVHGLDVTIQNPIYKTLWLPALRRMDRIIANSHSTAEFARLAGISEQRIGLVHPGVTVPAPPASTDQLQNFRAKHNLEGRDVLISVGRLTARKGLREFVQLALPLIVAERPDALLLIVGSTPNDALHAHTQTAESIEEVARTAGVANNVRLIGQITNTDELLTAYQSAIAHIFPVRHIPNDTEGFGMVAIEAAANGVPTVAFATGGIIDAVAEGESGYLAPPEDYEFLAQLALRVIKSPGSMHTTCLRHSVAFAWENFGRAVLDQLEQPAPSHRS